LHEVIPDSKGKRDREKDIAFVIQKEKKTDDERGEKRQPFEEFFCFHSGFAKNTPEHLVRLPIWKKKAGGVRRKKKKRSAGF